VRIERIVLKNHGNIPLFRLNFVDDALADADDALRNLFKASDHAKGGALATTGGANEDDEFLIGDGQIETVDGHDAAGVDFADVFELDAGHRAP